MAFFLVSLVAWTIATMMLGHARFWTFIYALIGLPCFMTLVVGYDAEVKRSERYKISVIKYLIVTTWWPSVATFLLLAGVLWSTKRLARWVRTGA